jgi:hypothetical protein
MMTKNRQATAASSARSERIELKGLFATMLGVWYPKNYIVAAVDSPNGKEALRDLISAGFGNNSINLRESAEVAKIRAKINEQRGPMQRAAATVSRTLTDEGLMSQEYFEEAEAGASLIAVLAPEPRLVTEAGRIIASHGARRMRFYGDMAITDL